MKVITFNLRNFTDDHWEQRLPLITRDLKNYDADVLAFQEVRGYVKGGKGPNMAEQIQIALPQYSFIYTEKAGAHIPDNDQVWEGLSILSKKKPQETGFHDLPLGDGPDKNKRILIWARYSDSGRNVNIVNNHFSYKEKQAYQNAVDTINYLKDFKDRLLFVGDLNALPDSEAIQYLYKQVWYDIWKSKYPGQPGLTYPSVGPTKRIDYQFTSTDLGWESIKIELVFTQPVGKLYPSDHFGVMSTIP